MGWSRNEWQAERDNGTDLSQNRTSLMVMALILLTCSLLIASKVSLHIQARIALDWPNDTLSAVCQCVSVLLCLPAAHHSRARRERRHDSWRSAYLPAYSHNAGSLDWVSVLGCARRAHKATGVYAKVLWCTFHRDASTHATHRQAFHGADRRAFGLPTLDAIRKGNGERCQLQFGHTGR